MDPLVPVARALNESAVRYVVIGVWGANYYADSAAIVFETHDRDLFLPLDADNLVRCWSACEELGLHLMSEREPLDSPHDQWLAARVIERRALTRATDQAELHIDLTLVMKGFDFETVWSERRAFAVDGVEIPVARLLHIVQSKHATGRDKDRLFLATHREARDRKQVFQLAGGVRQLHRSARLCRRGVAGDHLAKDGAVDIVEIGLIENDVAVAERVVARHADLASFASPS